MDDDKIQFDTEPMDIDLFVEYAQKELEVFAKNIKRPECLKDKNLSSFRWYLIFARWNESLGFLKDNESLDLLTENE